MASFQTCALQYNALLNMYYAVLMKLVELFWKTQVWKEKDATTTTTTTITFRPTEPEPLVS